MHDLPRQKLSELFAKHGHSLCDEPKRLEGLLKDMLRNEYKRETFVLISTLREGVVDELRQSTSGMPAAALAVKLARQLCDNLGLDQAVAVWSVESWAVTMGVDIAQPKVAPITSVTKMKASGRSPAVSTSSISKSPDADVDLAAIVMQHRETARLAQVKAEQERVNAALDEALAIQIKKDAETHAARLDQEAKAKAAVVQNQAKQLAEHKGDFATALQMLEGIEEQWRDAKLYENLSGYRDKVMQLDATIQDAVLKGRLYFLRGRVQRLLKLQPKRDDMRRLLEVLPDDPELATELTNSIGMKFVLIQPGEFMMGSNAARNEQPPHIVEITQPYYLGVFPVTQGEYQAVVEKSPSLFTGDARLPVESISWDDAVVYCDRLSEVSGEDQHGMRYRLPTEAEWEYACRAGSTGNWCFGDDESSLGEYAWFAENSEGRTHPVGTKQANNWGLHDMHGNVFEWCSDRYGVYRSAATFDPQGERTGLSRVLRGGSWSSSALYCRSAYRYDFGPSFRFRFMGFRLALSFIK